MNEKEVKALINRLMKIIERQLDYCDKMERRLYNVDRQISVLQYRLGKIEGMNDE